MTQPSRSHGGRHLDRHADRLLAAHPRLGRHRRDLWTTPERCARMSRNTAPDAAHRRTRLRPAGTASLRQGEGPPRRARERPALCWCSTAPASTTARPRRASSRLSPAFRGCGGSIPTCRAWAGPSLPSRSRSADDVLDTLLDFADERQWRDAAYLPDRSLGGRVLRAGDGRAAARNRSPAWRLVCPLLPGLRDVPEHRRGRRIGCDRRRRASGATSSIQTPEMLERYERFVAPAAALVDQAALERIGERWELTPDAGPAYAGPTRGRGGATGLDGRVRRRVPHLVDHYPHASLAVVDDAGHALPHEQPDLLRVLLAEWLDPRGALGRRARRRGPEPRGFWASAGRNELVRRTSRGARGWACAGRSSGSRAPGRPPW